MGQLCATLGEEFDIRLRAERPVRQCEIGAEKALAIEIAGGREIMLTADRRDLAGALREMAGAGQPVLRRQVLELRQHRRRAVVGGVSRTWQFTRPPRRGVSISAWARSRKVWPKASSMA